MASSKLLPLVLLLTTLFFSFQPQTQARDSQFFSKVTRHHDPTAPATTTTTATNFYNPETTTNNEFSTLTKQEQLQEEDPTFIPQSAGTGYGLYGHETGLDPPSTTTTTPTAANSAAYTTSLYNMDNNAFENHNTYYHNNFENHKNYAPELKGLSEFTTTTTDGGYGGATTTTTNNNNNYHYNRDYKRNGYEGARYYGGVEKQGMSDTRFLDNGMYFHDIYAEKKNDGANYVPYTGNYNTNYGNNYKEDGYVGYGGNHEFYSKNNYNRQGYHNQIKPEEEEFDFDP